MVRKDPTYTGEQIAEQLRTLPGWYYKDKWIRRPYKTDGWPTTVMLGTAIASVAGAAAPHPHPTAAGARRGVANWGGSTARWQPTRGRASGVSVDTRAAAKQRVSTGRQTSAR